MVSFKRLYFKIVQQEGSPTSIARGVALGLCVGFIVPIGLQTIIVVPFAFLLRANKVISWFATCISNPGTVFFLYPIQCYVGSLFLFHPLSMRELHADFKTLIASDSIERTLDALQGLGIGVLVPFLVGGIFFSLITAIPGYIWSFRIVRAYRLRKERKRLHKSETSKS